jgi:hypothetical protein
VEIRHPDHANGSEENQYRGYEITHPNEDL